MRNSTSILSLVLALGIYGAGPMVTKFGPFAATTVYAEEGDEGGEGGEGGEADFAQHLSLNSQSLRPNCWNK